MASPKELQKRKSVALNVALEKFDKEMAEHYAEVYDKEPWKVKYWLEPTMSILEFRGLNYPTKFLVTQVGTDNSGNSIVIGGIITVDASGNGLFSSMYHNSPKLLKLPN